MNIEKRPTKRKPSTEDEQQQQQHEDKRIKPATECFIARLGVDCIMSIIQYCNYRDIGNCATANRELNKMLLIPSYQGMSGSTYLVEFAALKHEGPERALSMLNAQPDYRLSKVLKVDVDFDIDFKGDQVLSPTQVMKDVMIHFLEATHLRVDLDRTAGMSFIGLCFNQKLKHMSVYNRWSTTDDAVVLSLPLGLHSLVLGDSVNLAVWLVSDSNVLLANDRALQATYFDTKSLQEVTLWTASIEDVFPLLVLVFLSLHTLRLRAGVFHAATRRDGNTCMDRKDFPALQHLWLLQDIQSRITNPLDDARTIRWLFSVKTVTIEGSDSLLRLLHPYPGRSNEYEEQLQRNLLATEDWSPSIQHLHCIYQSRSCQPQTISSFAEVCLLC
jgi:hypothetical protein